MIKHLFLNAILEKFKIPLLIELRYLNDDSRKLEEYIRDSINVNKISVNPVILDRLLEKGKFVFFLDGYDELDADTDVLCQLYPAAYPPDALQRRDRTNRAAGHVYLALC